MTDSQPSVLIAGATGYLGRHLIQAYGDAGYRVRAVARSPEKLSQAGLFIDDVFAAEATKPETLKGCCDGVDLVVSALGITTQKDGLTYDEVDYQANKNILDEALHAGVGRFAYIHVLHADHMQDIAMVRAKSKFAAELEAAPIPSIILCPSGFYSDLVEFVEMAKRGRVYLVGDGKSRMAPIHGADMAAVCVEATRQGLSRLNVGGPDTYTQSEIAELAFRALNRPRHISHVSPKLASSVVNLMRVIGMRSVAEPASFFLRASQINMTAPAYGTVSLDDQFREHASIIN